ncbi:MAG: OmpA family protein [Chthoniobacteraceae bacterium]
MKHGGNWLGSVSDLMSGLMMVFLLISVAFMLVVQQEKQRIEREKEEAQKRAATYLQQGEVIRQIVATYSELQVGLYQDLLAEFKDDLPRSNATLQEDNTVRFNEPDVLFEAGKSTLRDKFKVILDDFFPRYVSILTAPKYRDNIAEVRVEGHTSTEWERAVSLPDRYLHNARLSQERALAVVQYAFMSEATTLHRDWLIHALRANGLSFAQPVLDADGREDKDRSRRVDFRVFTKTKEQILRIIEVSEEQRREDTSK